MRRKKEEPRQLLSLTIAKLEKKFTQVELQGPLAVYHLLHIVLLIAAKVPYTKDFSNHRAMTPRMMMEVPHHLSFNKLTLCSVIR